MSGGVADSIIIHSFCYGMPVIVTEIILYHTTKRIDFNYKITVDTVPMREAYIVFPFENENPKYRFQGLGVPVDAFDDIVPGANTNQYACRNWCAVDGNDYSAVMPTLTYKTPPVVFYPQAVFVSIGNQ